MSVLYYPVRDNIVADALNWMTMGSNSHLDEAKKYLAKEYIGRLGWV